MDRRSFISKILGLTAALGLVPSKITHAGRHSSGNASQNFEFAIIGAGLFGSAAARHLSESSDSVALIGPAEPENAREHEGVFASHYDASRLVRVVDPDPLWATLAKSSIARFRQLEHASGIKFYDEIGYMMVTPGGLGRDWFDLPAMREVAADLDVGIEDLDDAELKKRFPYLRLTPGSSAVLQERNAGYINPRNLLTAQQKIGDQQGVTLLREIATYIRVSEKQVVIGLKSGGTVQANRVLVATGAYCNAAGLTPGKLDIQVRAAMIMESEVAPRTQGDYPTTLYAKTDGAENFWGLLMPPIRYADGRTYIKTMDGYYGPAPLTGSEELNAWSRGEGHAGHHHVLERALREVYPSLEVRARQFKPCLITDTASRYPYIDMLDERIGVVAGGNGKAAKSSDEIGRLAADMIRAKSWLSTLPQAEFAARFL